MIKVLIATFSQSGATKKVAYRIANGLASEGCQVTHHKINGDRPPGLAGFDLIGIGTPTYFFTAPLLVKEFVNNLYGLESKSTFVFTTQGTHRGNCGNWLINKLRRKGAENLGYFHCFGADYWLGYLKRGTLFSPDSPDEVELAHSERFGKKLFFQLKKNQFDRGKPDKATPFIYSLERMVLTRPFIKYFYSQAFYADRKCTHCGECIRKCPVRNIAEKSNGKLKWETNCMMCCTCELCCPENAIHSAADWILFAPFMKYNIRSSKKKGIPFTKVVSPTIDFIHSGNSP